MRNTLFADRADAGRHLGTRLLGLRGEGVVVLGLPRGGVPVGFEVARALDAPLDVILVRKLGVPAQPELGMGAIGEDDVRVLNSEVIRMAGVDPEQIGAVERRERAELERRARRFRGDRARAPITGRTVVIVDDGIATGSTARAACAVARLQGASKVILAVPVAPEDWTISPGVDADEFVCLARPRRFRAIGNWYDDFSQTSDEEVIECLDGVAASAGRIDMDVEIPGGAVSLAGHLTVPRSAEGIVVFVHGSGSSRLSPRNRHVAQVMNEAGLATLLFDLLTPGEARHRSNVFDIELLASRLITVMAWLGTQPQTRNLAVGLFGASTGAAAALRAAADPQVEVGAVVSRGGRPDLAAEWLQTVAAPTRLIVGSKDSDVLRLNRDALDNLDGTCDLAVVEGASHLFEEPGTLDEAARLAREWYVEHLSP